MKRVPTLDHFLNPFVLPRGKAPNKFHMKKLKAKHTQLKATERESRAI